MAMKCLKKSRCFSKTLKRSVRQSALAAHATYASDGPLKPSGSPFVGPFCSSVLDLVNFFWHLRYALPHDLCIVPAATDMAGARNLANSSPRDLSAPCRADIPRGAQLPGAD